MSRIKTWTGSREAGAGKPLSLLLIIVWIATCTAAAQHEQHQPSSKASRPPGAEVRLPVPGSRLPVNVGWEPIRCWRQASAGAVSIGETFTVVLTCAVYEGDNAQVVPDESRLGVASIQMAPFEILGGAHPPDVRRGSRRFFQYDYHLRIIGPDAIGSDVNIPPLTISYRIHSQVGAAATLQGRDLSYLLPMMPIKVLSLVPADAADIRDASEASLAAVDSLRFRSNAFRMLALALGTLAMAMVVLALIPLARLRVAAADTERGRVPDRAILTAVGRELDAVQTRTARDGWTDDLVARAAALVRIVAAAAIDHPISQLPLRAAEDAPEGRLRVTHGSLRSIAASVSSAVTADEVMRARTARDRAFSTTRRQQLEGLAAGLATTSAALYRREPARDSSALDEAIRHALAVAREISSERGWMKQWTKR